MFRGIAPLAINSEVLYQEALERGTGRVSSKPGAGTSRPGDSRISQFLAQILEGHLS